MQGQSYGKRRREWPCLPRHDKVQVRMKVQYQQVANNE